MKRKLLSRLIEGFFRPAGAPINAASFPAQIANTPGGIVPDNVALYGLLGSVQNIAASLDLDVIAVAGGAAVALTLTAAQFNSEIIDFGSTAAGGITVTTPTAAAIIANLPNTLLAGQNYNTLLYFINDNSGQTVTMVAGAGVTILGNLTIATNTMRQFLVSVNPSANTVTMMNMGTQNL